jgi:hypothetical protein
MKNGVRNATKEMLPIMMSGYQVALDRIDAGVGVSGINKTTPPLPGAPSPRQTPNWQTKLSAQQARRQQWSCPNGYAGSDGPTVSDFRLNNVI